MAEKIYLAGKFVDSTDSADVVNPYDNSVIAQVHEASLDQAAKAVEASVKAGQKMRGQDPVNRSELLAAICEGIAKKKEDLARTIALEAGKPITLARGEVGRAVFTFKLAAEEASRISGSYASLAIGGGGDNRRMLTSRFPVGPVLAITPFNFPLNLVAHKLAPAFACGAPVILKPAPKTPLSGLKLAEIFREAGAPEGSLSVLPCKDNVAGSLLENPGIRMLNFTGSAAVGWKLRSMAGEKRVLLELGGNAAAIVHEDANIEYAAKRLAFGAYVYAGQVCISVQRIFVHEPVMDAFKEKFKQAASVMKCGAPMDEEVVSGPMISSEAADRVEAWVNEAVKLGAKEMMRGSRDGNVLKPTALDNVDPSMKVSCEEVFGPVAVISPYKSFEEALHMVNDTKYGLQSGVFTSDIKRIMAAFETLEVGGVIANDFPTYRSDVMPYGGIKASGLGREGLRNAIREMTEEKVLVLNLDY